MRLRRPRIFPHLLVAISAYPAITAAAAGSVIVQTSAVSGTISAAARDYLNAALDIVEKNSVNRGDVDWASLRTEAFQKVPKAHEPSDTYDAIRFVLATLPDRHSGFADPQLMKKVNAVTAGLSREPEGQLLPARLGYVLVPQFASGDQNVINGFATRLHQVVKDIDGKDPCGWIVDLRQNGGGNMWPMLAGLGPILGEGKLGAFVSPGGREVEWAYKDGAALNGTRAIARVSTTAYQLRVKEPPVAVLTSRVTASSGEAVAIAFRGRPATRSFGQPTRGLTTANTPFFLSDGAMINLATAFEVDRLGHIYGNGVAPDEQADDSTPDSIPKTAQDWLMNQPSCRVAAPRGRP